MINSTDDHAELLELMRALGETGRGLAKVANRLATASAALKGHYEASGSTQRGAPDLEDAIRSALERHGLNAELDAVEALNQAGLWVTQHPTLFDRDEDVTREYDIAACTPPFLPRPRPDDAVPVVVAAAIEVKTSDTPWVVVRPSPDTHGYPIQPSPVAHIGGAVVEPERLRQWILGVDHPATLDPGLGGEEWFGSTIVEPLGAGSRSGKGSGRQEPSFEARLKACKAAEDLLAYHRGRLGGDTLAAAVNEGPPMLIMVKPVVIVRGPLLAYWKCGNSAPVLESVRAASITQDLGTRQYDRGVYTLDVISDSYAEQYGRNLLLLADQLREFVDEADSRKTR